MSSSSIYENGTAELALARAIFPFFAVMGLFVIGWHFGGFESQATEIDRILATISTRLAWMSLFAIPFLGLVLRVANPPRLRLSPAWIISSALSAVVVLVLMFWLISNVLAS